MKLARRHALAVHLCAFTLVELLVVLVVVGLLVSLLIPIMAWSKSRSRTTTCTNNLKYLGTAFSMYDVESGGSLPPAGWRVKFGREMSWDDWLDWHLGGNLSAEQKWSSEPASFLSHRHLACPELLAMSEAQAAVPRPRTYAMPRYVFHPRFAPWPPTSRSRSGVGVVWDFGDGYNPDSNTMMLWELGEYSRTDGLVQAQPVRRQASVRSGMIRNPAGTLLLAERPGPPASYGSVDGVTMDTAAEQLSLTGAKTRADAASGLPHKGRSNYLMVDGHVEMGIPEQTIGTNAPLDAQSGLWTITPRD